MLVYFIRVSFFYIMKLYFYDNLKYFIYEYWFKTIYHFQTAIHFNFWCLNFINYIKIQGWSLVLCALPKFIFFSFQDHYWTQSNNKSLCTKNEENSIDVTKAHFMAVLNVIHFNILISLNSLFHYGATSFELEVVIYFLIFKYLVFQ